jgi:uncharacterized protein (TIGR02246 family)
MHATRDTRGIIELNLAGGRVMRSVRRVAMEVTMRGTVTRISLTLVFVVSCLLCVVCASASQGSPPADRASDREKITSILRLWEEAWNSHDMHAFAGLFHEDGTWVLFTGEVWKGRAAIEAGHAAVHKTIFRNSVQRERLEELTFVGPDAAVVRFYSTLTGHEQSPDKVIRSRKFLVVTRRGGEWRIGWGQNTRLADSTPD